MRDQPPAPARLASPPTPDPTKRLCIVEGDDPDRARRLTLTGELDIASAPELGARLRELGAARRRVRLDLSQLGFADSTGISTILLSLKDASRDGWELEVDPAVAPQVARLIMVTGLERKLWPPAGR
jgi:anti-anti-sigma factor